MLNNCWSGCFAEFANDLFFFSRNIKTELVYLLMLIDSIYSQCNKQRFLFFFTFGFKFAPFFRMFRVIFLYG